MFDPKRVLVVVAHPDDEVLGCGGTIKKLSENGAQVLVLYLNNGCDLRNNFKSSEIREQVIDCCKIIGAVPVISDYPTARMHTIDPIEFNRTIQSVVNGFAPELVITHDPGDLHKDHRTVYEATMVACRFKPSSQVKSVWTFPVISSSDISPRWGFNHRCLYRSQKAR